ncbi:M1 family aminopeptidase [Arachidicoccus terrestris]|uniref:M1 family aminopeptidase n=1 Tax=Arachidicoccus terrestris TaxID=2875539 RepID=UPI001CC753EE|nr:M1 family aminopeptidase [Arachidicoccus terrestris]UAY55842.1 hypothetical protein K9M52_02050 [Arachidicoccus terrestris]
MGRVASFYGIVFIGFTLILLGFVIGQNLRTGPEMGAHFSLVYYLYPLLVFGLENTIVVCSLLFYVAYKTKNRILVVIGGLLVYVLYMVLLMYSGSPFMSDAIPQSKFAQQISAILDPFGLSSYFYISESFSAAQRNNLLVPLNGFFLLNRVFVLSLSSIFVFLGYKSFSFRRPAKHSSKKNVNEAISNQNTFNQHKDFIAVIPAFNISSWVRSIKSYVKLDLLYVFKNIALPATSVLLLFYVGMEIYAEINQGIRLPQKYVSSGLVASTINESFYLLGVLLAAYFANDICWRSHISGFSLIENATFYFKSSLLAHWLSNSLLILFFTFLLITEGVLFQILYGYSHFDIQAYWGVFVFNTFPLILFAAFLVLLNSVLKNKFMALGCTVVAALIFATSVSNKLFSLPLLRFFSGYKGPYSDFNGYGAYLGSFAERLIFGYCVIGILWIIYVLTERKISKWLAISVISVLSILSFNIGSAFLKGYQPENEKEELAWAANYEKQYRKFQDLPQPTIIDVKTRIALYNSKNIYSVNGNYIMKNLSNQPIDNILINFSKDLEIEEADFAFQNQTVQINKKNEKIKLIQPMKPGEVANLSFRIAYKWKAVNRHHSFNSIIRNGSFMRISRYFPSIGYQSSYEIEDKFKRKEYGLGDHTQIRKLETPKTNPQDFINLDMLISTEIDQTAIGTGELIEKWKTGSRQYFHYRSRCPIPFRFAVASAKYAVKSSNYKGIKIDVFYLPQHFQNVQHLIDNTKSALEYCTRNFGPYPFESINFAEISSFTKGFNATAYPAVIFMAEDIAFHANLKADKQQDVINELAGHELSHLWWGNSQISPDNREGQAMLTETLAMYTEMMICKKVYGKEKMLERLKVQCQIYDASKGFAQSQPLYKVTDENPDIYYSKGAIIMVRLSQIIGEETVNKALRNFLEKYKYPNRPITKDVLNELYKVADKKYHRRIKKMFTEL